MHKKIALVFVGIALAVSAGVVAQVGGFPSRPKFQAVGVGVTAPATPGQILASGSAGSFGQVGVRSTGAGIANIAYYSFSDTNAVRTGYVGDDNAGDAIIGLVCESTNCQTKLAATGTGGSIIAQTNGTTRFAIQNNGIVYMPGNYCTGGACDVANQPASATIIATKNANTNRLSTTTPSADPELLFTNVPAGYYRVRVFLNFDNAGAAGVSAQMRTSSTFGTESLGTGITSCNGAVSAAGYQYSGGTAVNFLGCTATSDDGAVTAEMNFFTAGASTIDIAWAQQTSVAANTTLQRGSYIELTRLN